MEQPVDILIEKLTKGRLPLKKWENVGIVPKSESALPSDGIAFSLVVSLIKHIIFMLNFYDQSTARR